MHAYGRLAAMIILSFVAMYVLMYAMVDSFANVYSNVNQVYMAGLMAAPMALIELLVMAPMYKNKVANVAIIAGSVLAALAFFALIRQQALVGDTQFLRSMIPHHGGAVLMCGKAPINDAEIKKLCASIIEGQQSEISQMKSMLDRLTK
jgi:uncharacterized protein (DUF305 family)